MNIRNIVKKAKQKLVELTESTFTMRTLRTLIYVPTIHTYAELGYLAFQIKESCRSSRVLKLNA